MTAAQIESLFQQAMDEYRAGRLAAAERQFEELLRLSADEPRVLRVLAMIAFQSRRLAEAVNLIERAIHLRPADAGLRNELGVFLAASGRPDGAVAALYDAAALDPKSGEIAYNLGNALKDAGKLDAAIAEYRRAAALSPDNPDIQNNLAVSLHSTGHRDEALDHFRRAAALRPLDAGIRRRLALALQQRGHVDEAVIEYREAGRLSPHDASTLCNLGNALYAKGLFDESLSSVRQAIAVRPDSPAAYNTLGLVLKDSGRVEGALEAFRKSIQVARRLRERGARWDVPSDLGESDVLRAESRIAGNYLFTLLLRPGYDGERIRTEHEWWNQTYAAPLCGERRPHRNDRNPRRQLRVGYVSADFRNHPAGYTLLCAIGEHDHRQIEVHLYSDVTDPDVITERFRSRADVWHDISGVSDHRLAENIRDDGIDVLVDLSVHSAGNRLLVFARKPAPVQISFAGYPATTGLETMDFRFTDAYLDPPGEHQSHYTEEPVRLPHSFWGYDPVTEEPPVNELPALRTGRITFGCLSNFSKVNSNVLRLWAGVLRAVAGSKMIVLAPRGSHRDEAAAVMRECGVGPDRLEFAERRPRSGYLELYHSIDVALDTLPWNGHVTTLDAFWMGVPTVTLPGATAVGRGGLSLAANLGLQNLIARSEADFVACAAALVADCSSLAEMRAQLRRRLRNSPLMNSRGFGRALDEIHRKLWARWCGEDGG